MLGVVLAIALASQTVAVTLDTGTVIMTATEAQRQFETTRDPKLKAALVWSLGTLPDERQVLQTAESPSRAEQLRWMRRPVQRRGL